MISAQKNRTFKGSDYQKIQKVYSIWICPYARNEKNTVTTYDIRQNKVYGETDTRKEDYDKLETVVITMNAEGIGSENDLIRYLSLLLNKEMPVEQREKRLESDYHLQMTDDLRKDVGIMCNYSDAMLMLGEKKGRAEGRAEGRVEGRAEGRAEGEKRMGELIAKLVAMNRYDDIKRCTEDQKYLEKLYQEFQLN